MAQTITAVPADAIGKTHQGLSLGALGVVYGDIGTSPLYTVKQCIASIGGISPDIVYGVLSLISWSLVTVVTLKYVIVIMRADNRGEGGILALTALALRSTSRTGRRHRWILAAGLTGAALFYGDGVITPAISVLSAVEGLKVATPVFEPYILPITVILLLALFLVQRRGTALVGGFFGPVMVLWFICIGLLGAIEIIKQPGILWALNPYYGLALLADAPWHGFILLGAVVLAVTGAEALYADMGHFGRTPIRTAWLRFVFPALLLNYFGQGALVLRVPDAVQNPFYLLAPRSFLYPLVAIATLATVVASQALISGAFSLTQQCVQLHYSPRVSIVHTSRSEVGQIYIPEVNTALMIGCLLLVLGFESSSALGAAYGVAVTGTMAVTTVLFYVIARQRWHWSALRAGALAGAFLVIDLAFFGANIIKIADGGWVPLAIGGGVFLLMNSWHRGADLLRRFLAQVAVPMDRFLDEVERTKPPRVRGTAVFLTHDVDGAPLVLQRHLLYNKALHERIILLSIITKEVPEVEHDKRVTTEALPQGFHRVRAYYGFMERPDAQEILAICGDLGIMAQAEETIYYVDSSRLLPTGPAPMMRWRKRLFSFMARNASAATDFFSIPPNRVV